MGRTLNKELHNWWTAIPELTAIVPGARVSAVGVHEEETSELDTDNDHLLDIEATISTDVEPGYRTNSKQGWKTTVTVEIFGDDPDRIEEVGDALSDAWHVKTYDGSEYHIRHSKCTKREQDRDEDGFIDSLTFEMRFEAA